MKERVFLRGLQSDRYSLEELRKQQHESPRIRRGKLPADEKANVEMSTAAGDGDHWIVSPGDQDFLTQTLQVHYMLLPPGGSNGGHGHQNEAAFFILEGEGYDIHDGLRYEWSQGDLLIVHADSVHRHFNGRIDRRALALVFKAKAMWMYMGLIQQGKPDERPDLSAFGPALDWTTILTPGVVDREKLVHPSGIPWMECSYGRYRELAYSGDNLRFSTVDITELEVAPGQSSERMWRMADQVLYVLEGSGASTQWDVQAEITDKFYAHIALDAKEMAFTTGDAVYVPQNTVHRLANTSPDEPLKILVARNRAFAMMGYDNEVVIA